MTEQTQIRKRRTLIEIAQRHQHPGAGSAPSFLARRTIEMAWTDLTPVLSPILWAVVGAAATRLYMPERTTKDLDIAILVQDAQRARQKLTQAGFKYQGELSIGGATWRAPDGQFIDVIEVREPWWTSALAQAQNNRDAQGLPVLLLPYLVLMKFQAGRVQDLADISRMLGQADAPSLDAVRELFRQYAPIDIPDPESLISLGKMERDS
jgi:hypothetical protein